MKPTVLGWRAPSTDPRALGPLWQNINDLGWLPEQPIRIVIQVGHESLSPVVSETVHALALYLENRLKSTVEVLDAPGSGYGWKGLPILAVAKEDVLELSAAVARAPLIVPRFWFSPHFLVTVTGAVPSPTARIAAVLDAQAGVLRRLGNAELAEILVYEAHRLAASDLSVVCGTTKTSGFWWAIGTNDVAVEQAVAHAAGIEQSGLPWLRALARHELLNPPPAVLGGLPSLHDHAAPAWR
ncbi:MAG TPA: hypothetical protein VFL31_02870, partial [Nitrospiraceae bacterium]|nr:hypothetical protein [Nitrospiraceae bacterium]